MKEDKLVVLSFPVNSSAISPSLMDSFPEPPVPTLSHSTVFPTAICHRLHTVPLHPPRCSVIVPLLRHLPPVLPSPPALSCLFPPPPQFSNLALTSSPYYNLSAPQKQQQTNYSVIIPLLSPHPTPPALSSPSYYILSVHPQPPNYSIIIPLLCPPPTLLCHRPHTLPPPPPSIYSVIIHVKCHHHPGLSFPTLPLPAP